MRRSKGTVQDLDTGQHLARKHKMRAKPFRTSRCAMLCVYVHANTHTATERGLRCGVQVTRRHLQCHWEEFIKACVFDL